MDREKKLANGEIKSHVYGKRQTWDKADKTCPEQFLWIKLAWNDLFLSRGNKQ